jgi:hypothetical protein
MANVECQMHYSPASSRARRRTNRSTGASGSDSSPRLACCPSTADFLAGWLPRRMVLGDQDKQPTAAEGA